MRVTVIVLAPSFDRPDRPRHVPPRGPAIDGRPIEHIWAGEIEAGLLRIVDSAFGIARDEAITATARAFGFVRVGQGIREAIEGAINRLVSAGQIQESDAGAGLVRVRACGNRTELANLDIRST